MSTTTLSMTSIQIPVFDESTTSPHLAKVLQDTNGSKTQKFGISRASNDAHVHKCKQTRTLKYSTERAHFRLHACPLRKSSRRNHEHSEKNARIGWIRARDEDQTPLWSRIPDVSPFSQFRVPAVFNFLGLAFCSTRYIEVLGSLPHSKHWLLHTRA